MPIDRPKLVKLMGMTQSQNDGEALNAVRLANAMLKVNGISWSSLLDPVTKSRPAPPPPPKRKPSGPSGRGTSEAAARYDAPKSRFTDPDIGRMLSSLLRDTKGDFRNLIESLNEQWKEKHYLTERQYEVVMNAYEREK